MAVINIRNNTGSPDKIKPGQTQGGPNILPEIKKRSAENFFVANTPDTAGMNKRRF